MPYRGDDSLRVSGDAAFDYELRDSVVLVVLRGRKPQHRWRDVTRLCYSALRGLDPASILFVEFDPVGGQFSLLHMRWSERLWSYCYSGATVLSETMLAALGLGTAHWRRSLAHLMRPADPPASPRFAETPPYCSGRRITGPARVAGRARS